MNVAGIDVAHKTLALAIAAGEKMGKATEYANTASGHRTLIKVLKGAKVERICLEATGSYHLDLALALDAAGLAIMVVNPKAAKHFAEALLSRTKTDAADAAVLAQFARSMPFEPWQRPDEQALAVRACARRIEALSSNRTQAKNQLHALSQSSSTPPVVLEDVHLSIAQYDNQIQALGRWVEALIATDAVMQQAFDLLLSVKGIASASAIQILGELLVLPADMRAKQWVALAGLDPRQSLSGTSVNKKPRLSKAGNRHLRLALYMPALCATRHDPHVKAYYRHLIEDNGLKKIQAVCAVMRKLLHAIHGMLKQRLPFDGSRFYAMAQVSA